MLIRETSQVGLFVVGIIIGILLSLTILSRRDVIDTKLVDSVFHGDVSDTIVDMPKQIEISSIINKDFKNESTDGLKMKSESSQFIAKATEKKRMIPPIKWTPGKEGSSGIIPHTTHTSVNKEIVVPIVIENTKIVKESSLPITESLEIKYDMPGAASLTAPLLNDKRKQKRKRRDRENNIIRKNKNFKLNDLNIASEYYDYFSGMNQSLYSTINFEYHKQAYTDFDSHLPFIPSLQNAIIKNKT